MKRKLACCEINKKSEQNTVDCIYCGCYFEQQELADQHVHEIHPEKVKIKRNLICCIKLHPKYKPYGAFPCPHCECQLRNELSREGHIKSVHECQTCHEIVTTDYQRDQHRIKHKKEEKFRPDCVGLNYVNTNTTFDFLLWRRRQNEPEFKIQRKKNDDDLVLNYVKKNKLDEYQKPPDHNPDFDYILTKHKLNKQELLALVKKFEIDFFNEIYSHSLSECFTIEDIIYLLENGAFSVKDTAKWMDNLAWNCFIDEYLGQMVEYFLNKDYEIKPEWIAAMIYEPHDGDDQRLERIKEKYSFTFDEIFNVRRDSQNFNLDLNKNAIDEFYVAVHKYFPDPDFEDPFADPYEDFKCVSNAHVRDYLRQRYFYDDEKDELSIVIGYGEEQREMSLGPCKEMLQRDLQDLIEEYEQEFEAYKGYNAEIAKGFEEMNEVDDEHGLSELQKAYRKEDIWHGFKDDIASRNYTANILSKLYFVISMKPSDDIKAEEEQSTVEKEQEKKGEPIRMPSQPFLGNAYTKKLQTKQENEAKQWSVTIRRRDGSIVPLSSLKLLQSTTK